MVSCFAYRGLLETGFIYDDWHWLRYALDHRPLPYLLKIINPLEPQYFYRPISRLLFYAEYLAFGRDASGWHLVSILLQAANGVLWGVLLHLLTRRALLGVLAALTFAVYPAMSEAVFWISDVEMLLGVFFGLLCLLLWSRFLLTASRPALAACLGCLVLSLLSKETMLVLAPFMVLVHLGLRSVRRLAQPVGLLPYAAVAVVLGLYLAADLYVLSHHVPVMGTSYVPGWHALADLYYYLQVLLTPFMTWTARRAPDLLLRLVVGMAVFVALLRRSGWIAAFLMAVAIIGLLPYLSWHGYAMRYTYVAALGVTGLAALAVCELLLWRGRLWPVVSALTMAAYALLLGGMLTDVQERRLEWEQLTNEQAKVLRDVQALDPALPSGSALYFLNSPTRSDYTVQMMYDMIDRGLRASTTDLRRAAGGGRRRADQHLLLPRRHAEKGIIQQWVAGDAGQPCAASALRLVDRSDRLRRTEPNRLAWATVHLPALLARCRTGWAQLLRLRASGGQEWREGCATRQLSAGRPLADQQLAAGAVHWRLLHPAYS